MHPAAPAAEWRCDVPSWLRHRSWWPALALGIALGVGLATIAARPDPGGGAVTLYPPDARPLALPLAADPPRRVDLNYASTAELEALPGIGAGRARAIIEARAQRPFASPRDAVERGVLPARLLDTLADWIAVAPAARGSRRAGP